MVLDLGACIRHLKERLGYKIVLLAGWSGGGSLSCFYQAQAELGLCPSKGNTTSCFFWVPV